MQSQPITERVTEKLKIVLGFVVEIRLLESWLGFMERGDLPVGSQFVQQVCPVD